jgi:hypothetical protein
VSAVSRDVEARSRSHFNFAILEPQPCCTAQYHDELVICLIVPEASRRSVTVGDNPFDAYVLRCQERLDQFVGQLLRQIGE